MNVVSSGLVLYVGLVVFGQRYVSSIWDSVGSAPLLACRTKGCVRLKGSKPPTVQCNEKEWQLRDVFDDALLY